MSKCRVCGLRETNLANAQSDLRYLVRAIGRTKSPSKIESLKAQIPAAKAAIERAKEAKVDHEAEHAT